VTIIENSDTYSGVAACCSLLATVNLTKGSDITDIEVTADKGLEYSTKENDHI